MKLQNTYGDTIEFDVTGGDGGTFSALLKVTELEDGPAEATFVLRPDDAIALAAALNAWARLETHKAGGLF